MNLITYLIVKRVGSKKGVKKYNLYFLTLKCTKLSAEVISTVELLGKDLLPTPVKWGNMLYYAVLLCFIDKSKYVMFNVMLRTLNHLWRIIATGFCFACFGLGGVLLTLFVFPLQKLFIRNIIKQKQMARKTVHYTFKFFIGLMAFTGVFKFDLVQAKALANKQGQLVLANHPSLIDVVVLISIIPNADCVVKAHLFKNPFLKGVVKNTGYISNADPEGLLVDCKKSLAAGHNLIIFPEGTRTKTGEPLKLQRGAANIALRCLSQNSVEIGVEAKNNISTVIIRVQPTTLTKSEPWYKVPEHKATFTAKLVPNSLRPPQVTNENISKQVREYNQKLAEFFIKELT